MISTEDGRFTYAYDDAGRLTQLTTGTATTTLSWNGEALDIAAPQRRFSFSRECDAPRRFVRPRLPTADAILHAPLLERTWENHVPSPFL